jgi:hypothetical protein
LQSRLYGLFQLRPTARRLPHTIHSELAAVCPELDENLLDRRDGAMPVLESCFDDEQFLGRRLQRNRQRETEDCEHFFHNSNLQRQQGRISPLSSFPFCSKASWKNRTNRTKKTNNQNTGSKQAISPQ